MATQDHIDILKKSGPNIVGFRRQLFFSDAWEKFERPGQAMLRHQLFQDKRRRDIYGLAGVVAFTVARRTFNDGIV